MGNTGGSGGGVPNTINVNVNSGGSGAVGTSSKDKVWMIAVGHDWGAMEYLFVLTTILCDIHKYV